MPQVDPELFDRGQFQAELALKASPIAAFKKAIRQAGEVLDKRFRSGDEIRPLIEARAWLVDNILQQAWNQFDWGDHSGIALVAVGGTGVVNCTRIQTSTCSFYWAPPSTSSTATPLSVFSPCCGTSAWKWARACAPSTSAPNRPAPT